MNTTPGAALQSLSPLRAMDTIIMLEQGSVFLIAGGLCWNAVAFQIFAGDGGFPHRAGHSTHHPSRGLRVISLLAASLLVNRCPSASYSSLPLTRAAMFAIRATAVSLPP